MVVITGGSRGIGKALVFEFLKNGYKVCTCSRKEEDLKEVYEGVEGVFYKACDVSKPEEVKEFAKFCYKNLKEIRFLINNAGVLGVRAKIEEYPEEVWREVIEINVNGVFYVTKVFLNYMKEGVIINLSSGVGKRPAPTWGAYAVSKWAVEGFSKTLAYELKNVKVFAVNPGGTRTRMRAKAFPEEDPRTLPPPERVAEVLYKIATGKLKFPTGNSIDAYEYF